MRAVRVPGHLAHALNPSHPAFATVDARWRRMATLLKIVAKNFKSLANTEVPLGRLNVLAGPNGAGKSNLLEVIGFLGDVARYDLEAAVERHGGIDALRFRGNTGVKRPPQITVGIEAKITSYASDTAPDAYSLSFSGSRLVLVRREQFTFKRTKGKGRRITVTGSQVQVRDSDKESQTHELSKESAALATLQKLGRGAGAEQVRALAKLLTSFEVFEPDVQAARLPSPTPKATRLDSRAANLAAFIAHLSSERTDIFSLLVDDMRTIVPGLIGLNVESIGGASEGVRIRLEESGLTGQTDLAHASYGTIRGLALLAKLHDPFLPPLLGLEEVDHGLHPYALDRLVERLRMASRRAQIIVATHSPTLINRLEPDELIICERDLVSGASRIPAITRDEMRDLREGDELGLGELWFTGTLGGVP